MMVMTSNPTVKEVKEKTCYRFAEVVSGSEKKKKKKKNMHTNICNVIQRIKKRKQIKAKSSWQKFISYYVQYTSYIVLTRIK